MRVAADGLIEEARVEREGSYPERQVWRITEEGRESLHTLRHQGLSQIVMRPDPFDLAVARLDLDELDALPGIIEARVERLRSMLAESEAHTRFVARYLSVGELHVMKHRAERLRAEIAWHEELVQKLPEIISDELSRKDER
jgi:DNA-binding PadR family transcriptional regulator